MSTSRIFYPISRRDGIGLRSAGQRYRHAFNDRRLDFRLKQILSSLATRRSSTIRQCSHDRNEVVSAYRFLSNPSVSLGELINELCKIDRQAVAGKELYVPIDSTSLNLLIGRSRANWADHFGVIENNRSPGFMAVPSLVLDAKQGQCYGLGDILIHNHPRVEHSRAQKTRKRYERRKLPLQEREMGFWSIVAQNTADQLQEAAKVTFIMDQGADDYETLYELRKQTGRDFILRAARNRMATNLADGQSARIDTLLQHTNSLDMRVVDVRALNHYSKSSGKLVQRKARKAVLHLKMLNIKLGIPKHYEKNKARIQESFYLIEVREDSCTVPCGEQPIRWNLLTSWAVTDLSTAWKAVEAYQRRWTVEQLFRVLKKQGYKVEKSQLGHPDKIKKLSAIAMKASVTALELIEARDALEPIPILNTFKPQEVKMLQLMSKKLRGKTDKTQNPYDEDDLRWAAWVVARAGGWKGYRSQRKPGPITMDRGLEELEILCAYSNFFGDP